MRVAFFASAVPFVLATIVPFAMVYLIVGVNINIPVIVDIVIVDIDNFQLKVAPSSNLIQRQNDLAILRHIFTSLLCCMPVGH